MALANTIFSGAGTDDLVTKDAYQVSSSAPINNAPVPTKTYSAPGSSSFSFDKGLIKDIRDEYGLSPDDINDLLGEAVVGSPTTMLKGMGEERVSKLFTTVGGASMAGGTIKVGDTVSFLSGNPSKIKQFGDLLSSYMGKTAGSFLGTGAEAGIVGALFEMAIENKAYDVLAKIQAKVVNEDALLLAGLSSFSAALASGDLNAIRALMDIIEDWRVGPNFPTSVEQVLANYRDDFDDTKSAEAKSQLLLDTLHRIDSRWMYIKRNGQWIPNLAVFAGASSDAIAALQLSDDHRTFATIASSYPERDTLSVLQGMYPGVYFKP